MEKTKLATVVKALRKEYELTPTKKPAIPLDGAPIQ